MLAIRTSIMAAGAAALLSTQAVYAAPAVSSPAIDPLVALSVFGTAQSLSAVCAAGASAAAAGAAVAATQTAPPGCLLPVTAPPAPPPVAQPAPPPAAPYVPARQASTGLLQVLGIGGAMVLLAVLVAALVGDDEEEQPISPA